MAEQIEKKTSFEIVVVSTGLMWILSVINASGQFINFFLGIVILFLLHPGYEKQATPELLAKVETVKETSKISQAINLEIEKSKRKPCTKSEKWWKVHGKKMRKEARIKASKK